MFFNSLSYSSSRFLFSALIASFFATAANPSLYAPATRSPAPANAARAPFKSKFDSALKKSPMTVLISRNANVTPEMVPRMLLNASRSVSRMPLPFSVSLLVSFCEPNHSRNFEITPATMPVRIWNGITKNSATNPPTSITTSETIDRTSPIPERIPWNICTTSTPLSSSPPLPNTFAIASRTGCRAPENDSKIRAIIPNTVFTTAAAFWNAITIEPYISPPITASTGLM